MNVKQMKQSLIEHPRQEASIKFPFIAGAMRRREFRGFLDSSHLRFDIQVEYTESKGFFESGFYVRATGSTEDILEFVEAIEDMGVKG